MAFFFSGSMPNLTNLTYLVYNLIFSKELKWECSEMSEIKYFLILFTMVINFFYLSFLFNEHWSIKDLCPFSFLPWLKCPILGHQSVMSDSAKLFPWDAKRHRFAVDFPLKNINWRFLYQNFMDLSHVVSFKWVWRSN